MMQESVVQTDLSLSDGEVVLLKAASADYQAAVRQALHLAGSPATLVCANRPWRAMKGQREEAGVEGPVWYVDCVSGLTGVPPARRDGVTFIEAPTMLEKMVLRTQRLTKENGGPLMLDALSTLVLYNGAPPVAEFVHTLATRLRMQGTAALLLVIVDQVEPAFLETIEAQVDRVITL